MKWTEDDTYKFVGLYRDYECLWNMSSANYKNKHMLQRAIEAIMQAMRREEFGVTEVKQKIKNIPSSYNQEVHKIQKIKASGTSPVLFFLYHITNFVQQNIINSCQTLFQSQTLAPP